MYAIEAIGLIKDFEKTRAVDDLDLIVEEGQVVALLGPNGAGKTTTLMMLLGVIEADAGQISLLGHTLPAGRQRALEMINFTASYVGMPYRMKIRHHLSVAADIYGVPKKRIYEVCEMFRITDLLERFTTHMSSGQKTLVGLAKAMLNRPRLLILDEPTASLDPEVAAQVRDVIRQSQQEEDFTLLITSHNMADIERLCERVIFIARGKVVADGHPEDVARDRGVRDLESTFLSIATEARP